MKEMLTISKVLNDAKMLGIRLSSRSFWSYCEQGLLPKGKKLLGRGNCDYFPADTLLQLYVILLLKDLRVPHSILAEACSDFVSDPNLLIHLREPLPSIGQSKRRLAKEYKNVLLETVKKLLSAGPPCATPAPIVASSSSTVKTLTESKGRKFREAPEVAPEPTPEPTPEPAPENPKKGGRGQ